MDFQTPDRVCNVMVDLLSYGITSVLEPTPGEGNLVRALSAGGYNVTAPTDFFSLPEESWYDAIVMNPPFSPMSVGYKVLYKCMEMSNVIIALMPWLTLINSQRRTDDIVDFGLVEVVHLPRKTFKGSRVQTCILSMYKGYHDKTTISFLHL